ncbi:MAG: hypothetical protein HOA57_00640 [Candidatus Magasanikbacteria bacterium]|nr:hypothetical protein [Candidatus Magasanikbacteria bacterium]
MLAWTIKNKKSFGITAILAVGFFVAVFLFFGMSTVSAADVPGANPQGPDTFGLETVGDTILLPATDIRLIVARIIRAVLGLLGIMTVVIMMYAGFLIMTAGGNEEKIIKGKKTMINGVIGLAIILSSFAIVQFVLNMLSGQMNGGMAPDFVKKPYINTYSGSGSLGKIVKDHYPMRDQIGVKRNTSIMVTFAEPIDPSSLIENTNNTCYGLESDIVTCDEDNTVPVYGDCVDDEFDDNFYEENCDKLIATAVEIYMSDDEAQALVLAAAMTSYDNNGDADTFVFKPIEPLGSNTEDVWYTVDLRPSILKKGLEGIAPLSIFSGSFSGHYLWEFQTDVNFDFTPPHVVMARPPTNEEKIPRNRIVQITFSEAMNPLAVQGVFNEDSFFENIIINRENPDTKELEIVPGQWNITNGYKTVEFISDEECGRNSCGEVMYCLPLTCKDESDKQCYNPYGVLLRTALLLPNGIGFASYPLSGVMDTADNALDGNNDDVADNRPLIGKDMPDGSNDTKFIGDGEKKIVGEQVVGEPDNYYWFFSVFNIIDREAPFVETVLPNLDQGGVSEKAPIQMNFSKVMRISTMDDLELVEDPDDSLDADGEPIEFGDRDYYPIGSCFSVGDGGDEDKRCLDTMWYVDASSVSEATATAPAKTTTYLLHRDLGPNGYDFYYFPVVPSIVTDENQNCLYPGYGPDKDVQDNLIPNCQVNYDDDGKIIKLENGEFDIPGCVDVNFTSSTDTGCIQTTESPTDKMKSTTSTCVDFLKEKSV